MGIKKFFTNAANKVGKFAGKVVSTVKRAPELVGKIVKPIASIAKPVFGVMSALPGQLGVIGKAGSAVASIAKNIVDRIPNQQAKNTLNHLIDKGKGLVDQTQSRAQDIAGKIKPYADAGLGLINNPPRLT